MSQTRGLALAAVLLFGVAGSASPPQAGLNFEVSVVDQAKLAVPAGLDYRLIVAGDGPFAGELRNALERSAPGRSLLLGHCRREELPTLYHAADVFLHPNPREPFGIAPLEAMAAGLPLVAPASGGILTYANRENAWLVENTPAAFAEAVASIYSQHWLHRRKTEKARKTAEEFSWTHITANYFQLYDQLHERAVQEGFGSESATPTSVAEAHASEAGLFV